MAIAKCKKQILKAIGYVVGRLTEWSSLKGVLLVLGGGSWHQLDSASRGEVVAQFALIALGLLNIFLPQDAQYRGQPPQDPPPQE